MFSRQSGLGSGSGGSGSSLVEFRAGRMNMVGTTVHPDVRKGLVYMHQSEDGLMHFCWKDRTTGKVEDDLIVFPDDFEFKRVEQCTTGRVYVLIFKTSSRRMFFWMQEPKTDRDEEYCRRINDLMNNPPSSTRSGSDSGDLQYMLNNMSQQQLMQLFGGVGQMGGLSSLLGSMNRSSDSTRTPSTNRSASSQQTPDNASSALPRTPSAPKGKNSKSSGSNIADAGAVSRTNRVLEIDLAPAIASSNVVDQLILDPQRAKKLSVLLPESEANADEERRQQIKETIASPQFQQALTSFSSALQSAQLGPVVSQFELTADAVAAAYAGDLEAFVRSLESNLPPGVSMNSDAKSDETTAALSASSAVEEGGKKEDADADTATVALQEAEKKNE